MLTSGMKWNLLTQDPKQDGTKSCGKAKTQLVLGNGPNPGLEASVSLLGFSSLGVTSILMKADLVHRLPSWIFGDAHHSLFLETASFLGSHHTLLAVSAHPWLFLLKPAPHASFSSPTYMLAFLKGSFLAPSLLPLHVPAGDLLARVASVTLWTL